jgi:ubiquinone/menaquinone biosynthesis C-methylase UbiE
MSYKFQRIYWSKKFDWERYARLYDKYCQRKNNYYVQSASELVKSVKLKNSFKIIDLACGTGVLTSQLLKKYPKINIFAIDLSKEMLYFYQKNFLNRIKMGQIKIVCGNAEQLHKYTKEKYDAIFIASALWDLELEPLFKNIAKVVKKNGLVVFNLPALVVGEEKGFIFFIEHFFREKLNTAVVYRRITLKDLEKVFKKYFRLIKLKRYSFKMSKRNVAIFFDLLRYRYPFIFFPKEMPYSQKLKKCTEIFNEALRYIPKDGISEEGFVFVLKKR